MYRTMYADSLFNPHTFSLQAIVGYHGVPMYCGHDITSVNCWNLWVRRYVPPNNLGSGGEDHLVII